MGLLRRRHSGVEVAPQREAAGGGGGGGGAAAAVQHARKKRRKEEFKRLPLFDDEPKGSVERWRDDPDLSRWWLLMRRRGVHVVGSRAYIKFRNKFRLPLVEVEKLVARAQTVPA